MVDWFGCVFSHSRDLKTKEFSHGGLISLVFRPFYRPYIPKILHHQQWSNDFVSVYVIFLPFLQLFVQKSKVLKNRGISTIQSNPTNFFLNSSIYLSIIFYSRDQWYFIEDSYFWIKLMTNIKVLTSAKIWNIIPFMLSFVVIPLLIQILGRWRGNFTPPPLLPRWDKNT